MSAIKDSSYFSVFYILILIQFCEMSSPCSRPYLKFNEISTNKSITVFTSESEIDRIKNASVGTVGKKCVLNLQCTEDVADWRCTADTDIECHPNAATKISNREIDTDTLSTPDVILTTPESLPPEADTVVTTTTKNTLASVVSTLMTTEELTSAPTPATLEATFKLSPDERYTNDMSTDITTITSEESTRPSDYTSSLTIPEVFSDLESTTLPPEADKYIVVTTTTIDTLASVVSTLMTTEEVTSAPTPTTLGAASKILPGERFTDKTFTDITTITSEESTSSNDYTSSLTTPVADPKVFPDERFTDDMSTDITTMKSEELTSSDQVYSLTSTEADLKAIPGVIYFDETSTDITKITSEKIASFSDYTSSPTTPEADTKAFPDEGRLYNDNTTSNAIHDKNDIYDEITTPVTEYAVDNFTNVNIDTTKSPIQNPETLNLKEEKNKNSAIIIVSVLFASLGTAAVLYFVARKLQGLRQSATYRLP